jgi:hypothetical protein
MNQTRGLKTTMLPHLCVPNSISDEDIYSAWIHLFGNNAIKWIETIDSKKRIHLHPSFLENLEEDELAEIEDLYDDLKAEGKLTFCLRDPTIGWWIYGRVGSEEFRNLLQFEVTFE